MKIVATIEARMDATRLPGKILKEILGKPMLELQVERIRRSRLINEVVVATTVAPNDIQTVEACKKMGVPCFRGSSDDVLDRVLKAAQHYGADIIVELTGDCPLLDPAIIDSIIQFYLDNSFDYVSNVVKRSFPRGMDIQVFSKKVLEKTASLTQDPADREHVSLFIYEHPEIFKLGHVLADQDVQRPDFRLTVDTPQDYELVKKIYERLYPSNPAFNLKDVIHLLENDPELIKVNSGIQQKAVR